MCCFSQPVEWVSQTNIFARGLNGSQYLVYSMSYSANVDLAMVLPLPVPPDSPEDAVRFINLENFPTLFSDLRKAFPLPITAAPPTWSLGASPEQPKLKVYPVGQFEASFVPRLQDFDRLDERFRISPQVWQKLPAYSDYGFAVFKLRKTLRNWLTKIPGMGSWSRRTVHPMAFEFPRRNSDLLFFPTVHIHDGHVHDHAGFDHTLYCQTETHDAADLFRWEHSSETLNQFVDTARTEGIVLPEAYAWQRTLSGNLPNEDTLVEDRGKSTAVFSS